MTGDRLNALAVLLIEKKLVQSIPWIICTKNKSKFFLCPPSFRTHEPPLGLRPKYMIYL
nr:unnamed protein product [Callosobruchus chinensis]